MIYTLVQSRIPGFLCKPQSHRSPVTKPTRLKLLTAAEQVILSEGVHALTVRRVGEVSGLNPTLITYHFGTVAGMLEELCEANLAPVLHAWIGIDGSTAADPRALLRQWLAPLLSPAALNPNGRALVVLDEIASHGEPAMRERLQQQMAGMAAKVRQSIAIYADHLTDAELAARLRYIAGAALGPPPRNRATRSADMQELNQLCRFAAAALELPAPSR